MGELACEVMMDTREWKEANFILISHCYQSVYQEVVSFTVN